MEVLHINLTEFNGKFVLTVVDRFSKCAQFVFLIAKDARAVAVALFSKIVTQWGLPRAIISAEMLGSLENSGERADGSVLM